MFWPFPALPRQVTQWIWLTCHSHTADTHVWNPIHVAQQLLSHITEWGDRESQHVKSHSVGVIIHDQCFLLCNRFLETETKSNRAHDQIKWFEIAIGMINSFCVIENVLSLWCTYNERNQLHSICLCLTFPDASDAIALIEMKRWLEGIKQDFALACIPFSPNKLEGATDTISRELDELCSDSIKKQM